MTYYYILNKKGKYLYYVNWLKAVKANKPPVINNEERIEKNL